jgi:hypothetical protein
VRRRAEQVLRHKHRRWLGLPSFMAKSHVFSVVCGGCVRVRWCVRVRT